MLCENWKQKNDKQIPVNSYPAFAENHVHALGMNAKKKLLGGMSLNGQAVSVSGITPPLYARAGSIKVPGMPLGLFSMRGNKI